MSDIELFLAVLIRGAARWEPFSHSKNSGEICVRGVRYPVDLDETSLPKEEFSENLREALAKSCGIIL